MISHPSHDILEICWGTTGQVKQHTPCNTLVLQSTKIFRTLFFLKLSSFGSSNSEMGILKHVNLHFFQHYEWLTPQTRSSCSSSFHIPLHQNDTSCPLLLTETLEEDIKYMHICSCPIMCNESSINCQIQSSSYSITYKWKYESPVKEKKTESKS